jgi:anti-sigma factor RsiW
MKRNRNSATQSLGNRVWQKGGDDDGLIKYLLGELSEQERDRIEDKYFADDALHERLLALEEDLTDAYVCGQLSSEQNQHFEKWFLRSPERLERLEFSRALVQYASHAAIPTAEQPALWQSILSFLRVSPSGQLALACALLALILIPVAIWQEVKHRAEVERQLAIRKKQEKIRPAETANLPKQPSSEGQGARTETAKPKLPPVFAFALTSVVRDGHSEGNLVRVPAGPARIQLKVEVESGDYRNYHATVLTPEGTQIPQTIAGKIATQSTAGSTVLVDLPDAIAPGDYILKLKGIASDGSSDEVAAYSFKVIRALAGDSVDEGGRELQRLVNKAYQAYGAADFDETLRFADQMQSINPAQANAFRKLVKDAREELTK